MNRLIKTFLPLCFALIAAPAMAQAERNYPAPRLTAERNDDGSLTVTAESTATGPGILFLLGSFEGSMVSLGRGLPSILAHGQILGMAFAEGETISLSAGWPPVHVLLQAVDVRFTTDGDLSIFASGVALVGERPITAAMVKQYQDDRSSRGEERARP